MKIKFSSFLIVKQLVNNYNFLFKFSYIWNKLNHCSSIYSLNCYIQCVWFFHITIIIIIFINKGILKVIKHICKQIRD